MLPATRHDSGEFSVSIQQDCHSAQDTLVFWQIFRTSVNKRDVQH